VIGLDPVRWTPGSCKVRLPRSLTFSVLVDAYVSSVTIFRVEQLKEGFVLTNDGSYLSLRDFEARAQSQC
jgi:hypothetical protein